jgi:hypothetical protein
MPEREPLQEVDVTMVGRFSDPKTGLAVDPPDVQVHVWPPGAPAPMIFSFIGKTGVERLDVGVYEFKCDQGATCGSWRYEMTGTRSSERVP